MADFTPWEVRKEVTFFRVVDGRNSIVASLIDDEANARLIAAAPELYEALKDLVAQPAASWCDFSKTKAALALVEGGSDG